VFRVSRPDTAAGEQEHDYVQALPGGKGAIVQVWKGSPSQNVIGALSFATGKVKTIATGNLCTVSPAGQAPLWHSLTDVSSLSPSTRTALAATTEPVQVLDDVRSEATNGTLQFAVSESGGLVYVPGGESEADVVLVSRNGTVTPVDSTWVGHFLDPTLSPDGTKLAIAISGNDGNAVWVKRLPNGSLTRLTLKGTSDRPTWSPDGRTVAYLGTRDGKRTAWMRRADGSNDEQPVNRKAPQLDEVSFSPDGGLRSSARSAQLRTVASCWSHRALTAHQSRWCTPTTTTMRR
jgi:hypothetical protein